MQFPLDVFFSQFLEPKYFELLSQLLHANKKVFWCNNFSIPYSFSNIDVIHYSTKSFNIVAGWNKYFFDLNTYKVRYFG